MAGMGHDAEQLEIRMLVDCCSNLKKLLRVREQSGTTGTAVDLDKDGKARIELGGSMAERFCRGAVIKNQRQVRTGALQRGGGGGLGGNHADGIEDVAESSLQKVARFRKGGDRDGSAVSLRRQPGDTARLGGLDMGAQLEP